jgi:hypothetical protein
VVEREGPNVNRRGVGFVPAVEGRDIAALAARVADTSRAVHAARRSSTTRFRGGFVVMDLRVAGERNGRAPQMVLGQAVRVRGRGLLECRVADLQHVADAPLAVVVLRDEPDERVVGEHVADHRIYLTDDDALFEDGANRGSRIRENGDLDFGEQSLTNSPVAVEFDIATMGGDDAADLDVAGEDGQ